MSKSFIIIDGNSIGHAAANTPALSVDGENVHAIFQSLKMIKATVKENKDEYETPLVLWDGSEYWRKDIYPEYKCRDSKDEKAKLVAEDYKRQRPTLIKALSRLGITQIVGKKQEADDIAGYLSRKYSEAGHKVLMVTGDKDWLQLVRQNVAWHDPVRKRSCNKASFYEFTGFQSTAEFLQGKALIGDKGDNIDGITGIGEKCAPLIMEEFGSVEGLFKNFESHKCFDKKTGTLPASLSRYKTKLNNFCTSDELRERYQRNIHLMDLMTVNLKADDLKIVKSPANILKFKELCEDHQFASITRTMGEWSNTFTGERKYNV